MDITANLMRQCPPDTILIPTSIRLDAGWVRHDSKGHISSNTMIPLLEATTLRDIDP